MTKLKQQDAVCRITALWAESLHNVEELMIMDQGWCTSPWIKLR